MVGLHDSPLLKYSLVHVAEAIFLEQFSTLVNTRILMNKTSTFENLKIAKFISHASRGSPSPVRIESKGINRSKVTLHTPDLLLKNLQTSDHSACESSEFSQME